MSDWCKENVATMVCTVVLVLGLYALGAGIGSFCGFALMMNMNDTK